MCFDEFTTTIALLMMENLLALERPSPSSMLTVFCTHYPSLLLPVVKSMGGVWNMLLNFVLLCGISLLFNIIIVFDCVMKETITINWGDAIIFDGG